MTMPAKEAAKVRPILFSAPMVRAILAGTFYAWPDGTSAAGCAFYRGGQWRIGNL